MVDFIAPTKRGKMTQARAAAIFLREQGRCYLCTVQLRLGIDPYEIEHPNALSLGGSDNDPELRVVCLKCHPPKTKQDAGAKAKRDRAVTEAWQPKRERRRKIQSPGFDKPPAQKTASTKTKKWSLLSP